MFADQLSIEGQLGRCWLCSPLKVTISQSQIVINITAFLGKTRPIPQLIGRLCWLGWLGMRIVDS